MDKTTLFKFRPALFLAILCCSAFGADAPSSVLGLEPGDLRLCNDDLGVILWGPDRAPTLSVGKSDVWDRRLPISPEPVLTLQQMIEMARAGAPAILNGTAYYTGYNSHDFPCPKPVGQVILQLPFLSPDGTLTVDQKQEEIHLHAKDGAKEVTARIFVSAIRNLIVIRGHAVNLAAGDLALRLYRHRDTIVPGGDLHPTISGSIAPDDFDQLPMPRAGSDDDTFWIAQDYPGENTFPKGFTALMAGRVSGIPVTIDLKEGVQHLGTSMVAEKEGRLDHATTKRYTPINESPGSAVTATFRPANGDFEIVIAVTTTQDDPDLLAKAQQTLQEAFKSGVNALWEEHTQHLASYQARPHARVWSAENPAVADTPWGGVPYAVRPAGYYGDVPLCSVASTKYCYQDSSNWHGDFHFNEVDATSTCMLRQFDSLDSYFRMIHTMLPMAQANAREVYDCAGAMYPLVHYPLRADSVIRVNLTWEQSMEISALLARPFWLRFQYTWDTAFLKDLAYPVLREGARFYADYVTQESDGLYHVVPTVSPEHRGITKGLIYNRDSQSAITLIRYHLRAASEAARLLDVDAEEAEQWAFIADRMPDYPTWQSPAGPIYVDVAGAEPMEYNIAVPLTAVFWGDDIGLDSPPEKLELALRTLDEIDVWPPHQGYLTRVRARLGVPAPEDAVGLEHVLQSYTGTIRVFPAVPKGFEGGFENLGAQGGFVVSSERSGGQVSHIRIESLAGNVCRLASPWDGQTLHVTDETSGEANEIEIVGGIAVIPTLAGHTYRLAP